MDDEIDEIDLLYVPSRIRCHPGASALDRDAASSSPAQISGSDGVVSKAPRAARAWHLGARVAATRPPTPLGARVSSAVDERRPSPSHGMVARASDPVGGDVRADVDVDVDANHDDMPPSALVGSLKRTARRFGGRLLRFGAPAYLKRKLATSEGTDEVYARLEDQVASPAFLANLSASRAVEEGEEDLLPEVSLEDGEDKDPRDLEYVFVEPDDVMISVADFVAACVAAHPDAADAAPEELQRAVARALRELREPNRGKVRRVWDYGVGVYRGVAWTYSTLTSFTNPWIARLVVCAVYTSARIALGGAAAAV